MAMDWERMFVPGGSLLELLVRGSALYLALFVMLRLMPRRQLGSLGVADVLVVVLIADAAQNGMAGGYTSITEGVVLVATILFWDYAIDFIDHRYPGLHLNISKPKLLVRNGRMIKRNMESENMSEDDLMSQLRQHGIEDLGRVRKAYAEGDGHISVITSGKRAQDNHPVGRRSVV
jgi:uncharacterized membrane protein YcaP (DUF421 family)